MIPYLGCERARELLEPWVDGELSIADQVAVESHLRWCRTCAARVEDMRLIGASVRLGAPASRHSHDERALAGMQASTLLRIRAERDQSFAVWFRGLFDDMRFLWPLFGATAAVLIVGSLATAILYSTADERRVARAASRRPAPPPAPAYGVILLETGAEPGSDSNPIRLDDALRRPSVEDWVTLETLPEENALFTLATVVSQRGRMNRYELLRSERPAHAAHQDAEHPDHVGAVLDAVRNSRFAPARTHGGRAVAVNMVWLIAKTTVHDSPAPADLGSRSATEPREAPPAPATDIALPQEPGVPTAALPGRASAAV